MNDVSDTFFDLLYRVRSLELRESQREIDSIRRRIERLESYSEVFVAADRTESE
jgi:hypothetical protein